MKDKMLENGTISEKIAENKMVLLLNLIKMANLLPHTMDAPRFYDFFSTLSAAEKEECVENDKQCIRRWLRTFEAYPRFITCFLESTDWDQAIESLTRDAIVRSFDEVIASRNLINSAVRFAEKYRSHSEVPNGAMHPEPVMIPMFLAVSNFGKSEKKRHLIELDHNDQITALEGTDIRRLRRCPICMKAFYAIRLDSEGCSPKHTALNKTRKLRRAKDIENLVKARNRLQNLLNETNPIPSVIDKVQAKIEKLETRIDKKGR